MASLHRHCPDPIWIVDDCFLRIFTACKKSPLVLPLQCKRAFFISVVCYIFLNLPVVSFNFQPARITAFPVFFLFHSYMFFLISFIYTISITRLCIIAAAGSDPVFPAFPLSPAASLHKPQRLFPHVDRCRFS